MNVNQLVDPSQEENLFINITFVHGLTYFYSWLGLSSTPEDYRVMEMYNASLVIVIFYLCMVAPNIAIGGGCGLILDELKKDVVKNLNPIVVDLKSLMEDEEQKEESKDFKQVPYILHNFVEAHFEDAEKGLGSLIHHLSSFTSSNNSEAIVGYSKHAIIQAKQARNLIHQIIQCEKNSTTTHEQALVTSVSNEGNMSDCVVDGTKCQYSKCAQGNRLPLCSFGFARGVIGGAVGPYYIVDSSDDDPQNPAPGTLRFAVNFAGGIEGGAWITFKKSMHIRLKDLLWINSNTTIDGRGVNVTITRKALALRHVENVILHNFAVRSTGYSDTIHVFEGTRNVWIDHITTSHGELGLITVLQGSTDVTISNCYLPQCYFNILLGGSDTAIADKDLRVTVYRNWFDDSTQRMPHCRWGYCHVSNNYYRNWTYYAIGARAYAMVYSELNVFNPGRKLEVTPWFKNLSDLTPTIVSSKDLLLKRATFHQFLHNGTLPNPRDQFPGYMVPYRSTDTLESLVTNCSGVLFGSKLNHCLATQ